MTGPASGRNPTRSAHAGGAGWGRWLGFGRRPAAAEPSGATKLGAIPPDLLRKIRRIEIRV
ncbi:MAG: hypothetical protein AAB289_08455, partial [Chloroflexota bacterium]